MRASMIDFSSWATGITTLLGLVLMTLVMVGVRLVFMQTIQKRRERENRQINERLRSLMAAYKTLGSSFTGNLSVSPLHLRDVRQSVARAPDASTDTASQDLQVEDDTAAVDDTPTRALEAEEAWSGSERQRRIRDAVEAALADVILLGTEEQVRMAAQAAQDMVAGRSVETAPLVQSLRAYIRQALDLEPIAADVRIPNQGPLRPATGGGAQRRPGGDANGRNGTGPGGRAGGGGGGNAGAGGGGMGMGMGMGMGLHRSDDAAA